MEIREWQISGLPVDNFSVENSLIVKFGQRWPLLIDPQGTKISIFLKAHLKYLIAFISEPALCS